MKNRCFAIPRAAQGHVAIFDDTKGNAEKSLSWLFSARKSKSAVFDFLHFLSLTAIENAWPSLASLGSALNQHLPRKTLI
jgi:hypothetical protein